MRHVLRPANLGGRAEGGSSTQRPASIICPLRTHTNRFNLTLGERLIDHLKNWLDPDLLLQSGPYAWKSGAGSSCGGCFASLLCAQAGCVWQMHSSSAQS